MLSWLGAGLESIKRLLLRYLLRLSRARKSTPPMRGVATQEPTTQRKKNVSKDIATPRVVKEGPNQ